LGWGQGGGPEGTSSAPPCWILARPPRLPPFLLTWLAVALRFLNGMFASGNTLEGYKGSAGHSDLKYVNKYYI